MSFLDLEVMFIKTKEYKDEDFQKALLTSKEKEAAALKQDIKQVKTFINELLETSLSAILESSSSQAKANYNAIDM